MLQVIFSGCVFDCNVRASLCAFALLLQLKKPTDQKFPVDPLKWIKSTPSEKHGTDRCNAMDKAMLFLPA